jgi:alkyl hydroperoxide reductase subunit AhpC
VRLTLTADDVAHGHIELLPIALTIDPVPQIGDTPDLLFKGTDSTPGTLANCRGHYTLVHFWASWCSVCMQQLPALHRVHDQYASRGVTILGLSLDEDASSWKTALARLAPPWREGRLDTTAHAGISRVPAYWILDPAGKIMAKVNDPDEAAKILAERLK